MILLMRITAMLTATMNEDSDNNNDVSDDDDTDNDESTNEATEVFKVDTSFNSVVDYALPEAIEPFISELLGCTVRTEIRARDAQQLVAEVAKYMIRFTAPTFSAYAMYGLLESVTLRLPSSSLYCSETGLRIVLHDVPGMDNDDKARAQCFTDELNAGLNDSNHAMLLHVDTTSSV
jgi:hypothetical protein